MTPWARFKDLHKRMSSTIVDHFRGKAGWTMGTQTSAHHLINLQKRFVSVIKWSSKVNNIWTDPIFCQLAKGERGFPGSSKESTTTVQEMQDMGLISRLRKILSRGNGNLPVFLPGKFHDERSLTGYGHKCKRVRHDWEQGHKKEEHNWGNRSQALDLVVKYPYGHGNGDSREILSDNWSRGQEKDMVSRLGMCTWKNQSTELLTETWRQAFRTFVGTTC